MSSTTSGKSRSTEAPRQIADVHGVEAVIEAQLARLRSNRKFGREKPLSREARDVILEFCRARKGEVSPTRFRTYLVRLPQVASRLGQEFLHPTRDAPVRFKQAFPESRYKMSSREGSWYVARAFWTWLFDRQDKPLPHYLKLKFPKNGHGRIGPAEVLTREDVEKIAVATKNLRDRAWVWALYNSRARPGELFRLRVGDVVTHEGYLELFINREKGGNERPAPIYEDAVPALLAWLDVHPSKADPTAPLWVSLEGHGKKRGEPISYMEMYLVTTKAARTAAVGKPAHPYAFRHAGLTDLAKDPGISESVLAAAAGWVPGSRRARTYVHVSNRDVTAALNVRYGITTEDAYKPQVHAAVKCGRCATVNRPDASFCLKCGGPLSLEGVKQAESDSAELGRLAEILNDPTVRRFLVARLRGPHGTHGEITLQAHGLGAQEET